MTVKKALNLTASEGGKLEFKSEPTKWGNDPDYPTPYSVRMWHPYDKDIPCDIDAYFAKAGLLVDDKSVCPKD